MADNSVSFLDIVDSGLGLIPAKSQDKDILALRLEDEFKVWKIRKEHFERRLKEFKARLEPLQAEYRKVREEKLKLLARGGEIKRLYPDALGNVMFLMKKLQIKKEITELYRNSILNNEYYRHEILKQKKLGAEFTLRYKEKQRMNVEGSTSKWLDDSNIPKTVSLILKNDEIDNGEVDCKSLNSKNISLLEGENGDVRDEGVVQNNDTEAAKCMNSEMPGYIMVGKKNDFLSDFCIDETTTLQISSVSSNLKEDTVSLENVDSHEKLQLDQRDDNGSNSAIITEQSNTASESTEETSIEKTCCSEQVFKNPKGQTPWTEGEHGRKEALAEKIEDRVDEHVDNYMSPYETTAKQVISLVEEIDFSQLITLDDEEDDASGTESKGFVLVDFENSQEILELKEKVVLEQYKLSLQRDEIARERRKEERRRQKWWRKIFSCY